MQSLPDAAPPADLAESARGWHRIQLAVLGFIGICGVLWAGGESGGPRWLHWLAAGLALVSLGLVLVATYLVGRVAFPLYGGRAATTAPGAGPLRAGIRLTYLAVTVVVVATLLAWWPRPADGGGGGGGGGAVEARDATGRSWCGELAGGPAGTLRLDTADGPVSLPLAQLATVQPVGRCD